MWTHPFLPGVAQKYRRVMRTGPRTFDETVTTKKIDAAMTTRRVRVVCANHCNSGWMSRLEVAVKPILTPLILDEAARFTRDELRILAAWITLKCMVIEFADAPENVVSTQEERTFLMDEKIPPASWRIWVARHEGELFDAGFIRVAVTLAFAFGGLKPTTMDGTLAKNTQSITFGIGKLVVHAVTTRDPRAEGLGPVTNIFPPVWKQVWPAPDAMSWRTSEPIADPVILFLAHGLARYVDTLPWRPGFPGKS